MKYKLKHWNFRIISHVTDKGEKWLGIHEVYYDEKEKPQCYSSDPQSVMGESIEDIKWFLSSMKKALDKPILKEEDFKK